jgi:hypothetical protein
MDEQTFWVTDMAVIKETMQGMPAMTFHGTPEWALDYMWTGDLIWIPSESQIRELLRQALAKDGTVIFDLLYIDNMYTCRFAWREHSLAFKASDAAEAYGAALLHVLNGDAGT